MYAKISTSLYVKLKRNGKQCVDKRLRKSCIFILHTNTHKYTQGWRVGGRDHTQWDLLSCFFTSSDCHAFSKIPYPASLWLSKWSGTPDRLLQSQVKHPGHIRLETVFWGTQIRFQYFGYFQSSVLRKQGDFLQWASTHSFMKAIRWARVPEQTWFSSAFPSMLSLGP